MEQERSFEQRKAIAMFALASQEDRIQHFAQRAAGLGRSKENTCVVLLSVDCPVGGPLAKALMPDNEPSWAEMRERGERPYARGLALREEELLPVVLIEQRLVLVAAVEMP